MARADFELVSVNMGELLRSEEVRKDLDRRARNIARAAGRGMMSSSTRGRRRAMAMVWTETFEAMHAEATTRALTRAVDAGRS